MQSSLLLKGSYTRCSVSILIVVSTYTVYTHQMPAKEDCAARSLVKAELQDEENVRQLKGSGKDDSLDDKDDDEGTHNKSRKETGNTGKPKSIDLSKENDETREEDSEETENSTCEPKSSKLSYNQ